MMTMIMVMRMLLVMETLFVMMLMTLIGHSCRHMCMHCDSSGDTVAGGSVGFGYVLLMSASLLPPFTGTINIFIPPSPGPGPGRPGHPSWPSDMKN